MTSPELPGGSDSKESLFVKLLSTFGAQIGLFVFGTAIQIVIARSLGPAGKGLYSLTLLSAIIVVNLTHCSLSSANSHFMGRYPEYRKALVGNSFALAFFWGLLISFVLYLVAFKYRPVYIPELNPQLWWLAIFAVIPLMLLEFSNGLVMGLDWMKRFSLGLILKEVLVFVGVLVLWLAHIISVESAVKIWLIACISVALLQAFSAWWRVGWKIAIDLRLLRKVGSFIFQAHVANAFSFLKLRIDMFIIANFLTVEEVGYYSVAMAMIQALWYLPTAISQVLIPHISRRNNQAGDQLTPRLSRFGFAVSLLGAILMALLGYPVIRALFGNVFMPAVPALLLLLPGAVVYTLAKMLAGDLIGRGLPKYAMYISIATLVVNVVVNIILIPRMGILGAAIASSLTHGCTGILFLMAFIRESKLRTSDVLWMKRGDFREILANVKRK